LMIGTTPSPRSGGALRKASRSAGISGKGRSAWRSWHPALLALVHAEVRVEAEPAITKIPDSLGLASSPPLPQARAPDPQLDFDPVLSVA
jgi:hypothetical protein